MENGAQAHVPVLAETALEWLEVKPDGVYVDCTAGAGGHAVMIAARLTAGGRLLAIDRDPMAAELAAERLREYACATVARGNYGNLQEILTAAGLAAVDGILIDAGLSSMQLNTPSRGFSFQESGPLDMRMNPEQGETAAAYLARVTETELTGVLRQYGDVGPARRIARAILRRRAADALKSTDDLADAVREALEFVRGVPEEIRTVFQAIRIVVNDELGHLERGLRQAVAALRPGGRLVVISFHSGEDRVVKGVLREASRARRTLREDGRTLSVRPPEVRILTPRPVLPDADEIARNPRAKSARLRVAERLAE